MASRTEKVTTPMTPAELRDIEEVVYRERLTRAEVMRRYTFPQIKRKAEKYRERGHEDATG